MINFLHLTRLGCRGTVKGASGNSGGKMIEGALDRERLLERLSAVIRSALLPVLNPCKEVALIDFPNHGNVGDSAIWLGERAFLKSENIRVAYQSDTETFNAGLMRDRIGTAPILLHGGGNFGDLYERHQRFRLRVLREFPNNRVVQLPQSIYFENDQRIEEAASAIEAHPDFHLLCRDLDSLQLARERFHCPSTLCPDMAVYLGPLSCKVAPTRPLGVLRRSDKEARQDEKAIECDYCFDWLNDVNGTSIFLNEQLVTLYTRYPSKLRPIYPLLEWTYDKVAMRRLTVGLRQLCEAERIITDRLHGHILCVLLDKPHAIVDNIYGKIGRFYECWTEDYSRVQRYSGLPTDVTGDTGGGSEDAVVRVYERD